MNGLPLSVGDAGEEVRDLQARLGDAGFPIIGDDHGTFGAATEQALERFQRERGLEPTGLCDGATWQALVEAGYRLGDRLLYLHAPMFRGDDVAELQLRLGALGFDAGRVDGIFGPDTEQALAEFQRNAGLPTDGIAGDATLAELRRLGAKAGLEPVAAVRERDRLRHAPRRLAARRVVLGDLGGLDALVTATSRLLRRSGATVLTLQDPDPSDQAQAANTFEADLYLGLELVTERSCQVAYFATTGFESAGGLRLAQCCAEHLPTVLGCGECAVSGMRLPILRETRMPAARCRLGPPPLVVTHTAEVAAVLAGSIERWAITPVEP